MPLLLLILALGTLAYLYWRWRTTTLTRDCRWRMHRAEKLWRCAFCGAESPVDTLTPPKVCLRKPPGT